MALYAKYTFYKNPPNRETGQIDSLYVKVVSGGKVMIDQLAEEIAGRSTFTSGGVKGFIKTLSKQLYFHLREGETVDVDGVGNFSVTLKTPKSITDPKQIRAELIHFNNVVYRASPELKHKLKVILLVRAILFKRKEVYLVSSTDCMSFNHCSHYQALKDLKKTERTGGNNLAREREVEVLCAEGELVERDEG